MSFEQGPAIALKGYLLELSTRRAFGLFFIAFLIGLLSIWKDFGLPWIPAGAVAIYGLVLLYCAKALQVSHSESTNNSPYFLGFLLFLASLLRAFYAATPGGQFQVSAIIHELGAALLTTIVGLPFRQALFAYSPSQADQDLFFRDLEEQLRRSAAEFRRAQVQMVETVQEFVEARRTLLADEQEAIRRYIKSLSKAVSVLDESVGSYPAAISKALESCTARLGELDSQVQKLAGATASIDSEALKGSLDSLPKIWGTVEQLGASISGLQKALTGATGAAGSVPLRIDSRLEELKGQLEIIPRAASEQAASLKEDLANIDRILETFVSLLQTRLEAIR